MSIKYGPNGNPWGGPRNNEHMPFEGHRTKADLMAEEREKPARRQILRGLGR